MATGVKDLKLWQEAVALAGEVIRTMRQSNRRETKAFSDHLMHSAVSVAAGIAEGYGRFATTEQRWFYRRAKRSLMELETELAIARQAGLVAPATLAQLSASAANVSRLLSGYLAYVERQIVAEQVDAAGAAAGRAVAHAVARPNDPDVAPAAAAT